MKDKTEKNMNGDYTRLQTKILIRTAAGLFGAFALIYVALTLLRGRFSNAIVGFLGVFYQDYEKALAVYDHVFRNNKEWFVMAAAFVVFLIILGFYLKGFTKYFNEINRGINALKEEDPEDVVLSAELASTEKTINEITRFNLAGITLEYSTVNLTRMLEQLVFEFKPMLSEKN